MTISFIGTFFFIANVFEVVAADTSIEDSASAVRAGDATVASNFIINNNFIDPSHNCEGCTKMIYTPRSQDGAGIAYKDDTLDLEKSQRIVFFAKGQSGEQVSFVAAGNDTRVKSINDTEIFPKINFSIVTDNLTLTNDWQRYEIGLNGTALFDATYPFGVQLAAGSPNKQVFYLKGVAMDNQPAQNPLPTTYDILNSTSVNSTKTLTVKIDANSTASPAPSTIEFSANSTGGLAPYSFSWNFGDSSNSTFSGQKVSHTFGTSGLYNITLIANDSGTPSQNASANMQIRVTKDANTTSSLDANTTSSLDANTTSSLDANTTSSLDANTTSSLDANTTSSLDANTTSSLDANTTSSLDANTTSSLDANTTSSLDANTTSSLDANTTSSLDANTTDRTPEANSTEGVTPSYPDTDGASSVVSDSNHEANSTESVIPFTQAMTEKEADSSVLSIVEGSTVNKLHDSNIKKFTTVNNTFDADSINHPPAADEYSVTIYGNEKANVVLKGSDEDNDPITFRLVSGPEKGTLAGFDKVKGTVTYVPNDISPGSDSFTFKVIDANNAESNIGRVSVIANKIESTLPIVSDVNVATTNNEPVIITLRATIPDNTQTVKFAILSRPSHGTLSQLSSVDDTSVKVTYMPHKGYSGNDAFKFKAENPILGSKESKVTITIIASPPGSNSSPVAINQNVKTDQNKRVKIMLEGTDTDGDKLKYSILTRPSQGKFISFDSSIGKLDYKPNSEFIGEDSFTFQVTDIKGLDSNIAEVLIKVKNSILRDNDKGDLSSALQGKTIDTIESPFTQASPSINHEPSASAGRDRSVDEKTNKIILKGMGKDPDGDVLAYSWGQTAGPDVDLRNTNTVTPTFNAPDVDRDEVLNFKLLVNDGKGGQDSDIVKITIKDKDVVNDQFIPARELLQDRTQLQTNVTETSK